MPESWTPLMVRAAALAAGAARTSPNPPVGCVVLDRDGEVVGEGRHERAGEPHAEVVALAAAGQRARGGTAVVTLEPCRHTGRTGPCTEALLAAGVARVVVGVPDPTAAAGGGADRLREEGVEVHLVEGAARDAAEHVARAWLTTMRTGLAHLVLKTATTLDGRVAAADGTSRWITGPEARAEVHALRAACDAVIVGTGTLRADDPHLAVRSGGDVSAGPQPLRVVLDPRAEIELTARVLDDAAPTLVVVAEGTPFARLADAGVDVLAVPRTARGLDLRAVLVALADRGARRVLLEGGPTLAASAVADDLVDEVVAYVAPALLGAGPTALGDAGIATISEALRLTPFDTTTVGEDVRISALVRRERS